jgi:hypothetical protein
MISPQDPMKSPSARRQIGNNVIPVCSVAASCWEIRWRASSTVGVPSPRSEISAT